MYPQPDKITNFPTSWLGVHVPIYCPLSGRERVCEHLRCSCMARVLPLPAALEASTEPPLQGTAGCLPQHPAHSRGPLWFSVEALLVLYFLGADTIFFCPLIFLGLSIPTNPIVPFASSSYTFLALFFSVPCSLGQSFLALFSSLLAFLASLQIISSCTFLSHPHIPPTSSFFPSRTRNISSVPLPPCLPPRETCETKGEHPGAAASLLLFPPNWFSLLSPPPLIFFLSHQGLVAFGLLIVFNILNEAHNLC